MAERQPRQSTSSRGRSQSRGNFRGRGRFGFFNKSTRDEEKANLDKQTSEMENVKAVSSAVRYERQTDPKASERDSRISTVMDKGKNFLSKFFLGFTTRERGNIKIELDYRFPNRLASVYADAIATYSERKHFGTEDEEFAIKLFRKFSGILRIAIACKLFKSSPEFERNLNFSLISVRLSDFPLPKKLNAVINQLGKTDLPNDNHIRIKNQWMHVKKWLLMGTCTYFGREYMGQYFKGRYADNPDAVYEILENETYLDQMIDNTTGSLLMLKQFGKEYFTNAINKNVHIKIADLSFDIRLPTFDFVGTVNVAKIRTYLTSEFFSHATALGDLNISKIVASLVLQVVKWDWLKKMDEKLKRLDTGFKDTIIENLTLTDVFDVAQIWNIEHIIDMPTLDQLASDAIQDWKTGQIQHFQTFLDLEEMKYSEYGTDAQMLEVTGENEDDVNRFGKHTYNLKGTATGTSKLKLTESGSIFGIMTAFSKKVEMSSDFQLHYDSKPVSILREFLRSDIKGNK